MKKIQFSFILSLILIIMSVNYSSAQIWEKGYGTMTFIDSARSNRVIDANIIYPADAAGINVPLGSPFDKIYPIIIFGHDEATPHYNYQYIWDLWTVKGFIVIVPTTEMTVPMNVEEFALDMAFIAKQFDVLRLDPTSMFYKRYNKRSCVMGHGKGGSAAIIASTLYPKITTMITLAANETVPSAIAAATQVTAPSVVVAAGLDCVSPVGTTQEAIFNNIASDCKAFINFTDASRCYFAQNAGICTVNDNPCAPVTAYWQGTASDASWYLVSFMRYYLKYNAPALNKFEWKLQQKNNITYIITCNLTGPRAALQNEEDEYYNDDEMDFRLSALELNLYPNPSQAGTNLKLTLNSQSESNSTVMITNMMGQLMYKSNLKVNSSKNEIDIPTNMLAKGSYMVVVTSQNERKTIPLIIQ